MTDVTPAIFTDDPEILNQQIAFLAPYVPWIQLDLSDGTMVPTATVMDMEKLKAILSEHKETSFEAHLMVDNPVKYFKLLADAGFKRIIAQVECSDPRQFLDEAQLDSMEVGLALDGASELDIIEPFLEMVDLVVIMTIEAGSPDAPFLPESLEKMRSLRHHYPDLSIAAEGNIDEVKGKLLGEAGVSRLVVAADTLLRDPAQIASILEALQGK